MSTSTPNRQPAAPPFTLPPPGLLTRFAPAPTGWLHLGHAVSALWVWGLARATGGRVLLRIEDHDRGRSRPAFEAGIVEELQWLGLEWDEGFVPAKPGTPSPFRQSDHDAVYEAALARLDLAGRVYACDCSRRRLMASEGTQPGEEVRYPGTCRDRGLPWGPGLGLRVRLDEGDEAFDDLRLGPQVQAPARQCGDVLVRDRLGQWTYQWCVVVDDLRQRIGLVVRGEDLLPSTGRQLRLARMLGLAAAPRFLHHPLVAHPDGTKLSKANHDTGLRELRAGGATPEAVLGRAAFLSGLLARERPVGAAEVGGLFASGREGRRA
ncbi:MAG: glutamate--tRNA ligase family protein [Gemmatimonadales bacterium]|nr:glutamate--tRNA ligase family protein [Gemmatimonadales bacterium]